MTHQMTHHLKYIYKRGKVLIGSLLTYKSLQKKYSGYIYNIDKTIKAEVKLSNSLLKDHGRYFYYLVLLLSGKKIHNVWINNTLTHVYLCDKAIYVNYLFKNQRLFISRSRINHKAEWIIADGTLKSNAKQKRMELYYGLKNKGQISFDLILNMPMHPLIYQLKLYEQIDGLRNEVKKIKVLFSGDVKKSSYDNPDLKKKYGITNRYEILEFLKTNLTNDELTMLRTDDDLKNDLSNKFVLNDGYEIKITSWLNILSKSHFFLACPGTSDPWCHNVIEAMSLGVIPILEYGHLFYPKLVHLKDCIIFSGLDDLKDKMKMVFNMKEQEIIKMKENVLAYYDKYLDMNTQIQTIAKIDSNIIKVHMPFINR